MKTLVLSLLLVLTFLTTKAEFGGYFIKFSIETVNGKKIEGYLYVGVNFVEELIGNNSHLTVDQLSKLSDVSSSDFKLNSSSANTRTKRIRFFKHRVKYNVQAQYHSYFIYSLVNETQIDASEIRRITIIEKVEQSMTSGVFNRLAIADSVWFNKPPQEVVHFEMILNEFLLFIHKKSKKTDDLIVELRDFEDQLSKFWGEGNIDNSTPSVVENKFCEALRRIKTKKHKVVVVTSSLH
jgi:hypothetical protein